MPYEVDFLHDQSAYMIRFFGTLTVETLSAAAEQTAIALQNQTTPTHLIIQMDDCALTDSRLKQIPLLLRITRPMLATKNVQQVILVSLAPSPMMQFLAGIVTSAYRQPLHIVSTVDVARQHINPEQQQVAAAAR